MMDKMKQLWALKKQMDEVKRELDNTVFDMTSPCGTVKISMNGSQETSAVTIQSELAGIDKTHLEKILRDTYNKAIKRSHEIAAQKMKSVSGLNIPGLT